MSIRRLGIGGINRDAATLRAMLAGLPEPVDAVDVADLIDTAYGLEKSPTNKIRINASTGLEFLGTASADPGAIVIDQDFTPIWTALHTFGSDVRIGQGLYVGGTATDPAPGQITAYNAGTVAWVKAQEGDGASVLMEAADTFGLVGCASNHSFQIYANNAGKMTVTPAGLVGIGETDDSNMTVGLTINQGANDDTILSLKSSDVAHGITGVAETDTYGFMKKIEATSGGLRITGLKDADGTNAYALYLQGELAENADTTKSTSGLGIIHMSAAVASGTGGGTANTNGNLLAVANYGSTEMILDAEGDLWLNGGMSIGGGWVKDANCDYGLTIDQSAADDCVLVFKSSDVAHGMTDYAETDSYGRYLKYDGTAGGLDMEGYSENQVGIFLSPRITNDDTTKSISGLGAVTLETYKKTGTSIGPQATNANLFAVRNSNNYTRFILDADGDSHQDVGTVWTNFHGHDDIALLNTLSAHLTAPGDPLKATFGDWLEASREPLERARLVTFNPDGHNFVNWSRMHMLEIGAVLQLAERIEQLEKRL
jgi:hypothetical protein